MANLPEGVLPLEPDASFVFDCHPGVACFTDCCRELELALTPYDVLRLRQGLGMGSAEFLHRHVVIERDSGEFPRLYLGMVDDGRASCPFVSPEGCLVYAHRPGACRAYPMGQASFRASDDMVRHFHVLLQEPHCHGFGCQRRQTAEEYIGSQGLGPYNESNDAWTAILHHPKRQAGMRLSADQADFYIMALYDLDAFRGHVQKPASGDDVALLQYGMRWLQQKLFDDDDDEEEA